MAKQSSPLQFKDMQSLEAAGIKLSDSDKQKFNDFFSQEQSDIVTTAFPQLSKFLSSDTSKRQDEDKSADKVSSAENSNHNTTSNEMVLDSLDAIDERLKVQNIVLVSSLEQQTQTNQLLNRLVSGGGSMGNNGNGNNGGTLASAAGGILDDILNFKSLGNFIKNAGKYLMTGASELLGANPELLPFAAGAAVLGTGAYAFARDPAQGALDATNESAIEAGMNPSDPEGSGEITSPQNVSKMKIDNLKNQITEKQAMLDKHHQELERNQNTDEEKRKLAIVELKLQQQINDLKQQLADETKKQLELSKEKTQQYYDPMSSIHVDKDAVAAVAAIPTPNIQLPNGVISSPTQGGNPVYTAEHGGFGHPAGGNETGGLHPAGIGGFRSTTNAGQPLGKGNKNLIDTKDIDTTDIKSAGFTQEQWNAYRLGVTDLENKGGNYDLMGGAGHSYAGMYQMGSKEITDTAKRLGVDRPTNEQFLHDPKMQEKFFENYTMDHYNTLMKTSPAFAKMSKEDQLKWLAYAHNQGVEDQIRDVGKAHIVGAAAAIRGVKGGHDAFGTSAYRYFNSVGARLAQSKPIAPIGQAKPGSEVEHGMGLNANDPQDREKIYGYMKEAGIDINPENFAWCAAWVNAQLRHEGIVGSGSALANSFANWSKGENSQDAKPGDIMELNNGSHVGRFTGETRMGPHGIEYEMASGNSGNANHARGQFGSVTKSWYPANMINFRQLPKAAPKSQEDYLHQNHLIDYQHTEEKTQQNNNFKENHDSIASSLVSKSNDAAIHDSLKVNAPPVVQMFNHQTPATNTDGKEKSERISDKTVGSPIPPKDRLKELFSRPKDWYDV